MTGLWKPLPRVEGEEYLHKGHEMAGEQAYVSGGSEWSMWVEEASFNQPTFHHGE